MGAHPARPSARWMMAASALLTALDLTTPSSTRANVQAAMIPTAYSAVVMPASRALCTSSLIFLVMSHPSFDPAGLSRGELINVNVPAVSLEECEGFEVTRLGRRVYSDQLVERMDPRGIPYFWIGGPPPSGLAVPETDFHAVVNRRIAVTPIHLDLTGRRLLRRLKTWAWDLPTPPKEKTRAGAELGESRSKRRRRR